MAMGEYDLCLPRFGGFAFASGYWIVCNPCWCAPTSDRISEPSFKVTDRMSEPEPNNVSADPGENATRAADRFRLLSKLIKAVPAEVSWCWLLVVLIPPVAVVLADLCGATWFYGKGLHETIAIPVLVIAAAAWLGRAVWERSAFIGLVAAQVVVFLLREIHFGWTKNGVYVLTAIIGLVGLRMAWRTDWKAVLPRVDWRLVSALAVTVASYAVALIVQRRAFKGIPGEERLHIAFEEVLETGAHLCFLASAFVRTRRKASEG